MQVLQVGDTTKARQALLHPRYQDQVFTRYINANSFPTKGTRFLKKGEVGKLKQRRLSKKEAGEDLAHID